LPFEGLKHFFKKLKNLLSTRAEITVQIIDKNFNCHDIDPILVEAFVYADEQGKVVPIGNSQGASVDLKWLTKMELSVGDKIRKQFLKHKNGEDFCVLLTKPKEEEIT